MGGVAPYTWQSLESVYLQNFVQMIGKSRDELEGFEAVAPGGKSTRERHGRIGRVDKSDALIIL